MAAANAVIDTKAVEVYKSGDVSATENTFMPAMRIEVALARRAAIVEFTSKIMVKDQDFGTIPGTNKPSLLKPGAEKLCSFFGLEPEFTPITEEIDWTGEKHGGEPMFYVRYRCRLMREGRVLGVGEGSCNSWESKYRYRWLGEDQLQPGVDKDKLFTRGGKRTLFEPQFAIDRAETTGQYGKPPEYWQRFNDAIADGSARPGTKPKKAGGVMEGWEIDVDMRMFRVPNPDVADVVNTIQKMAQKRALVAATLIATSASEFFTQDVEDSPRDDSHTIDTGGAPKGTREAQQNVADRKIAEGTAAAANVSQMPSGSGIQPVDDIWRRMGTNPKAIQEEISILFGDLVELIGGEDADEVYKEIAAKSGSPTAKVGFARRIIVELWKAIETERNKVEP